MGRHRLNRDTLNPIKLWTVSYKKKVYKLYKNPFCWQILNFPLLTQSVSYLLGIM